MKFFVKYLITMQHPKETWSHIVVFTTTFKANRAPNIGERMPIVDFGIRGIYWQNQNEFDAWNARVVDIQNGYPPTVGQTMLDKPEILETTIIVQEKVYSETLEEAKNAAVKMVEQLKTDPDCIDAAEYEGPGWWTRPVSTK